MDLPPQTEQDKAIKVETEDYKPYGPSAGRLLFAALKGYNISGYSIAICEQLLKTQTHLYEKLGEAHDTKRFRALVDAVPSAETLHLSGASTLDPSPIPHPISDPVAPPSNHTPSVPASREIPSEVYEILDSIGHDLRELLAPDWKWPLWTPDHISASAKPDIYSWLCRREIPLFNNEPNLLIHRLGSLQRSDPAMKERIDKIFIRAKKPTLFVNSSGSGKTRHMLEALCRKWGFYFCSTTESDGIGSADMMDCIESRLLATPGFTEILRGDSDATDFKDSLEQNCAIARDCITQVLLSRLLVFRAFLKEILASGRKITEDDRLRWVYFQFSPTLFTTLDIFSVVAKALNHAKFSGPTCEEINRDILKELLNLINSNSEPGNGDAKDGFHCIFDEAQHAANLLPNAFRSHADRNELRAVLRELMVALARFFRAGVKLTIGGTGLDRALVNEVMTSVIGKNEFQDWKSTTGSFDKTDCDSRLLQESYIREFIPETILETGSGRRLIQRISDWLGGRFRLTASFLANLLTSDFENPHQFLNDWVQYNTGFRPTDAPDLTSPLPVTRGFKTKELYRQIDFVKMNKKLSASLTQAVYRSLLRSGIASTYSTHTNELVKRGFAQYSTDNMATVCISEPLILLATVYYINYHQHDPGQTPFGQGIWDYVIGNIGIMAGSKYNGFESYLAFLLADEIATQVPLKDVFEFPMPMPAWANHSARLVTLSGYADTASEEAGLHVGEFNWRERAISTPTFGVTCDVPDTLAWLQHKRKAPFCFPDNHMGPDLLCVLELDTKELIWVSLQAKFLQNKFSKDELLGAIRTTVPAKHWIQKDRTHYAHVAHPTLFDDTQAALRLPKGANIGTKYPLLRVVVFQPDVGIDQLDDYIYDNAKEYSSPENYHDPDGHVLCTLNWHNITNTAPQHRDKRFTNKLKYAVRNPIRAKPHDFKPKRHAAALGLEESSSKKPNIGSSASTTNSSTAGMTRRKGTTRRKRNTSFWPQGNARRSTQMDAGPSNRHIQGSRKIYLDYDRISPIVDWERHQFKWMGPGSDRGERGLGLGGSEPSYAYHGLSLEGSEPSYAYHGLATYPGLPPTPTWGASSQYGASPGGFWNASMAAASSQYGAGGHGSPWGGSVATSPPPTPASSQYGDGRHGSPWGGSVATPPPSTRASSQYADDRHGSPWNDGVATPPVTPTYSRAPPQYRARHGSHEVATPPPGTRYSPYHYPPSAAKDPRNGEGKDAEGFGRR